MMWSSQTPHRYFSVSVSLWCLLSYKIGVSFLMLISQREDNDERNSQNSCFYTQYVDRNSSFHNLHHCMGNNSLSRNSQIPINERWFQLNNSRRRFLPRDIFTILPWNILKEILDFRRITCDHYKRLFKMIFTNKKWLKLSNFKNIENGPALIKNSYQEMVRYLSRSNQEFIPRIHIIRHFINL